MRRRLAAAAGALALLALILVAALPARLVWQHSVAPRLPQLAAAEISGVWWRGRARRFGWGRLELGTLAWQPGRDGWQLRLADSDTTQLTARAPWRFRGRRLDRLEGWLPARLLAPWLPATAGGRLHLELDSVTLERAPRVTGSARWRDAHLGGIVDIELGTLALDLKPGPAGTTIRLTSHRAGAVIVRGAGRLREDGYRLQIDLRAAPGQHAVAQQLRRLGTPRPDGSVRITLKDNWQ